MEIISMSITDILKSAYRSILMIVTVALSMVLIIVAYSDTVNPMTWKAPAFLGLFMGPVLLICVIWLLVVLVMGQWRCALVLFFAMLISGADIARYCPVTIGSSAGGGTDTLRLLTFNTRVMGDKPLRDASTKLPVVEFVRSSGADVVCLQEYAFSFSKQGHTEQQLRKYMSDIYPYYKFSPSAGRKALGIAIYSRFPIKSARVLPDPHRNHTFAIQADLNVRGREVSIVTMHLCSNHILPQDRQLYNRMLSHFDSDSLQVLGEGISAYMGNAFQNRAQQVSEIRESLSDVVRKDTPLIICGDMNDTPVSYAYRKLKDNLSDAWCNAGFGPGFTFFAHNLLVRIDHIFYSRHFDVEEVKIHKEITDSDHYPVSATLVF